MIEGLYFRFYKITHLETLSVLLAYAARFLFFLRFLVKRLLLKKESVKFTEQEAIDLLNKTSPDSGVKPDYSMAPPDDTCDLSVIVPVYNHKDVLERCIDSLINQKTGFSYELILVDDGSTDGAQDLIEQYRTQNNVSIIHRQNGGIAAARNTGICHARGKYIMFADCDDYVHEDIIETLMQGAVQDHADIVMCAHALVKVRDSQIISRLPNISPKCNLLGYRNGDEIMNYAGLPWGKVYVRSLFENVRFFPGYWYEDMIIHSLIFTRCGKFTYIPEVKYEYQWYEDNFSHTQNSVSVKAIDRYWLLRAITDQYQEMGGPTDARYYTMLLKHISAYYYPSVSGLSDDVVEAMFVAGRQLLLQNRPSKKVRLPFMLRLTEKAVLDNDIALWKLCSVNQ